ncbi:MAG TPA: cytidylate kinase, partial [Bacteroides sp.]|nr:cytidylate kinase [Bacteroides sp.]
YSSKKWGDAKSYDLCLDSGKLGVEGSIELIKDFIALREKNF